jgi:hypothetical protein
VAGIAANPSAGIQKLPVQCYAVAGGVTSNIAEPDPPGSTKDQIYRSRGEAVTIGGAAEWTIHQLSTHFAGSTLDPKATEGRWEEIKAELSDRQLTDGLQRELAAVDEYLKIRNRAAHAITMVAHAGESTQIMRFYYEGSGLSGGEVTLDDLRREAQIARAGYNALRAVGRALHQDQPAVLAALGVVNRMLLLGNV